MNKCQTLSLLNAQDETLNKLRSLVAIVHFVTEQKECPQKELCGTLSVLEDLSRTVVENHERLTIAFTSLDTAA